MALNREKVVRNAEKLVSRGKLEAAIKEYRKVLKDNANDTNTLNRVGDLYARLERFDEAVRLFSQIAEKYTEDGFFVKAIAIYKKIIKFDPSALSVYERLAELYHRQGLPNEARSQFQFLADYYLKNNNLTTATTIYQRMAELEPNNPSYKLKLAELYAQQHFPDKSTREYRALAKILLDAGSPDEAVQVYNKALEQQGGELELVRSAVQDLHDRGFTGAAAKVLARAVDLNPAAASLAREMHLEDPAPTAEFASSPAGDSGDETEATVTASVESAPAPVVDADDTFHVPETSFDLDAAAAEAMAAIDAAADEDAYEDFTGAMSLDLDDDDDSVYQIQPPADMGDEPGAVFINLDQEVDLEVDLEADLDDEFEVEFDEDDSDLDETSTSAEESGTGADLDADLDAEIDADFLGFEDELAVGFDDEPVEIGAEAEAPEASEESEEIEIEVELEGDLDVDATAWAGDEDEAAGDEDFDEATDAQPVRREEDLLAEAKVFSKYGLAEKARDRLDELLEVNPRHLEGLQLLARMELEASDPESATALAQRLAEASLDAADTEFYDQLRGDFAAEGLQLDAVDLPSAAGVVAPATFDLEGDETILATLPESAPQRQPQAQPPPPSPPRSASQPQPPSPPKPTREPRVEPQPGSAPAPVAGASPSVDLDAPEPASARKSKPRDRIAQLLEDLSLDGFEAPSRKAKKTRPEAEPALPTPAAPPPAAPPPAEPAPSAPEPVVEPSPSAVTREPSLPAAPPVAAKAGGALFSLKDELDLDDLVDQEEDQEEDQEPTPALAIDEPDPLDDDFDLDFDAVAPAPARPMGDALDETGMSWLQDETPVPLAAAAGGPSEGGGDADSLFDEEDDFFDLAAELEAELGSDAMAQVDGGVSSMESQEGTLEEIIEGFKQGVSEHLGEEDYDTHFNLGIAYREMGLLDEAIGEFQLSSKDVHHLAESAGMLGMCFNEKGLPELSVRWYKKGLESPEISEDATLGLLYDLASTYEAMGELESAYRTFVEIYGINTNFRDVAGKMQALAPQKQA